MKWFWDYIRDEVYTDISRREIYFLVSKDRNREIHIGFGKPKYSDSNDIEFAKYMDSFIEQYERIELADMQRDINWIKNRYEVDLDSREDRSTKQYKEYEQEEGNTIETVSNVDFDSLKKDFEEFKISQIAAMKDMQLQYQEKIDFLEDKLKQLERSNSINIPIEVTSKGMCEELSEIENSKTNDKNIEVNIQDSCEELSKIENPFVISYTKDKFFLPRNINMIKARLSEAADISNIWKTLSEINIRNKNEIYGGTLKRYESRLKTFIDNISVEDYDDFEEMYEDILGDFFKIVEKNIIKPLMQGLYRVISKTNDSTEYKKLLMSINEYLSSCCIYTKEIKSGDRYTELDMEYMIPIAIPTHDRDKDSYIQEVERLPYFIDYLNEENKTETIWINGIYSIYRYEENN